MDVLRKIKRAIRGEVKLTTVALEAWRRSLALQQEREERASVLNHTNQPASLWNKMTADELLTHFQGAREGRFFSKERWQTGRLGVRGAGRQAAARRDFLVRRREEN